MNLLNKCASILLLTLGLLLSNNTAWCQEYQWAAEIGSLPRETIADRFQPPAGFARVPVANGSFEDWLRGLPLHPGTGQVHLLDGSLKANQHAHVAVVALDVIQFQECADSVIRLHAEYLSTTSSPSNICYKFTSGDRSCWAKWQKGWRPVVNGNNVTWQQSANPDGSRTSFRRYLRSVFAYAGTISLKGELDPVPGGEVRIGDVVIQPGSPGHAVLVVDMAVDTHGEKRYLLGQGYQPAQEFHVINNPASELSPWYSLNVGGSLATPEWEFDPLFVGRLWQADIAGLISDVDARDKKTEVPSSITGQATQTSQDTKREDIGKRSEVTAPVSHEVVPGSGYFLLTNSHFDQMATLVRSVLSLDPSDIAEDHTLPNRTLPVIKTVFRLADEDADRVLTADELFSYVVFPRARPISTTRNVDVIGIPIFSPAMTAAGVQYFTRFSYLKKHTTINPQFVIRDGKDINLRHWHKSGKSDEAFIEHVMKNTDTGTLTRTLRPVGSAFDLIPGDMITTVAEGYGHTATVFQILKLASGENNGKIMLNLYAGSNPAASVRIYPFLIDLEHLEALHRKGDVFFRRW
jgi:hypothetical protein